MTWTDGYSRPDDYKIIHEGQTIGRICRLSNISSKEKWCWTHFGPRMFRHTPKGGIAYSLDDANAAFRAAWERHEQDLQKSASQASTGRKRAILGMWADKFAIALLAITATFAAILALNVFIYPTRAETVGAAIGLFVVMAAGFVVPLWLIVRVALWVARVFAAEEAH
jgi:hypothetical protein